MKISLRTLMLWVTLIGVVTAALAQPSLFWMRLMFTVTVAFLAFAAVGALAARGKLRTFWIGAAVFGGVYAYVVLSEQQQSPMLQRALITQSLLDALAAARGLDVRSPYAGFKLWDESIYSSGAVGSGGMGGMGGGVPMPPPGGGGFFDIDPEGLQEPPASGSSTPPPGTSGFGENSDAGASGASGSMGPMPGMSGGPAYPGAGAPPMPPAWSYASYNHFLITGHCAFVILVGLAGGLLCRWSFGREEEQPLPR